jgi:hypothetical protein
MISHEFGFVFVHIPFNGSESLEEEYLKKNGEYAIASTDIDKLPWDTSLEGENLGNVIKQFHDYDLFAMVKSPYLRAVEMWLDAQTKLRIAGVGRLSLGNYYENLLNKWKYAPDDRIDRQVDYLRSTDGKYFGVDVEFAVENLFKYENLVDGEMSELNKFLTEVSNTNVSYYYDPNLLKNWEEHYDRHAIEMVNYVFGEDFDFCGYRKL